MKYSKIALISLTVLLVSNLLIPIEDVLATTTFVDALDVSGETIGPFGLAFNSDGTIMLVADSDGDLILEYSCSTGFDVSTCTNTGSDDLDIGLIINSTLTGLVFNSAGTTMLIVDSDSTIDEIKEFSCSVGFDVSTCTTTGTDDLNINGDLTGTATGVAFNSAGTTMLVADDNGDILEYSCSSGFDVSSCTNNSNANDLDISGTASSPTDLAFNSAGTKMFVTDDVNGEVNEYTLSVGFDVSTATFVNVLDISTQESQPSGIAFSTDGLTMLVSGDGEGGDISEFTLEVAFDLFSSPSTNTGGDGCDGECNEPTMGVISDGRRLVENGFTYNGKQIDVERFFTPYPLINVNVGVQNTAVFKIYDGLGPDNIKHFDLAFGLASGQIMGTSNAMIQWDKSFDGIEIVTVVDPHNVLDNVRVDTLEGKCRTDSSTDDCLIIIVNHMFRAPLESDIVATNVWDQRRNAWQNYFNHGVNVEGESLNPPNEYVGIYKGNLVHLIETGKNIAVDGQGNNWTFDKVWNKDYIPNGKIDDGITSHSYDRNHVTFSIYKYGQELLAQKILDEFCPKCGIESFNEINDIEFYQFPDTIYKLDDPIVQNMLEHENEKAMKTLQKMFDEMYNHDYKRIQPFQSD